MKTIIPSQRTSLSFDYENQRELMKEERFAGKQNSAGEMGGNVSVVLIVLIENDNRIIFNELI